MRHIMFIVVLVAMCWLVPTFANAVPSQIPYSGQLSENGQLVSGTRYFSFNLYADSLGGTPLAAQAESLAVTNGVYHTQLNFNPSVWDGSTRWLGVSVNSNPEMTPRTKIGSVPYAERAARADTANAVTNLLPAPLVVSHMMIDQYSFLNMPFQDTISVNAPANGFASVTFSGQIGAYFNGTGYFERYLTLEEGYPITPKHITMNYYNSGGSHYFTFPITVTRVFPTTAGTHVYMFFISGNPGEPVGALYFYGYQASAIWLPAH